MDNPKVGDLVCVDGEVFLIVEVEDRVAILSKLTDNHMSIPTTRTWGFASLRSTDRKVWED